MIRQDSPEPDSKEAEDSDADYGSKNHLGSTSGRRRRPHAYITKRRPTLAEAQEAVSKDASIERRVSNWIELCLRPNGVNKETVPIL